MFHAPRPTPHALGHRVNNEIHREPGIVFAPKALVPPVVVPLAPVILVRVDDPQPTATLEPRRYSWTMLSPQPFSSWLVCGGPRGSERTRDRAHGCWDLWQRQFAGKDRAHFRLERLRVQAVHVMIAVVREQQAAVLDEPHSPARSFSLKRTSLWPVMNRNGNASNSAESAVMTTSSW